METSVQIANPEETNPIFDLDDIVLKLGDLAPPVPEEIGEGLSEKRRAYIKAIITVARQNSTLLTREEMARILAADFLLQAIEREQQIEGSGVMIPDPETQVAMPPGLDKALKVISEIIKNANNYQDALRAGVIALQNCIPFVGGIVAAITSLLWPQRKKSAWEQVKDQVNRVVHTAIFENEYKIVQSQITAVQISLTQYLNSSNSRERGVILIATMILTNSLYERVNHSKYRHMLLGLMAPIGLLHLTILSERYHHYKELFGDNERSQALKELKSTYDQYRQFFDTVFVEWKKWRDEGLKEFYEVKNILWSKEYRYGVKDELGQYQFEYRINDKARAADFKKCALNRSVADMADILSSTANYSTFFKGIDVALPPILTILDTIILGPYLGTRFPGTGNEAHRPVGPWSKDRPEGFVHTIHIYAYNTIDGLQFIYPDMDGTKVTGGGGESFVLDLKKKHCVGARLGYAKGLVYRLEFVFADGSTSPLYGNKGGWSPAASVDATMGGGYKLHSGNFEKGAGPSQTVGINGVILTFKRV